MLLPTPTLSSSPVPAQIVLIHSSRHTSHHTSGRKHFLATPVCDHPPLNPLELVFYRLALNYSPGLLLVLSSQLDAVHLVCKNHIFSFLWMCLQQSFEHFRLREYLCLSINETNIWAYLQGMNRGCITFKNLCDQKQRGYAKEQLYPSVYPTVNINRS